MAETSTIFGFMKYVSATDILSNFKKTVDSYFVNSLKARFFLALLNDDTVAVINFMLNDLSNKTRIGLFTLFKRFILIFNSNIFITSCISFTL